MNLGMMEIHGMEDDIVPYKGSYWFVLYINIYIERERERERERKRENI